MASGWNQWVWLQCIGVASRCCYKEVYRYPIIIINLPYSTCIRSFFGSSILTSLFIFNCFFGLYIYIPEKCASQLVQQARFARKYLIIIATATATHA